MGRSNKPVARYFTWLNYDKVNIRLLQDYFEVVVDDKSKSKVDVLFLPPWMEVGRGTSLFADHNYPNVKIIVSNTTSTPNVDKQYVEANGVKLVSLEGQSNVLDDITPVAELTIALMVMLTRNLLHTIEDGHYWDRYLHPGDRMLSKMRLGIVGMGRIGQKVAEVASAMGMYVMYYDPHVPWHTNEAVKVNDLNDMLRSSDIVTIHANLTPATQWMFSANKIFQMQYGSYLINTARGNIVEMSAVIAALDSGHLAGAAVDVLPYEEEGDVKIPAHDNLIVTPHIGGSTRDAWRVTQQWVIFKTLRVWREINSLPVHGLSPWTGDGGD